MADRIPFAELVEKLTALASESNPTELSNAAFWIDGHHDVAIALRDGTEALMQLARDEEIGFQLNGGWRCDVELKRFSVEVCDNRRHGDPTEFPLRTIYAATAQGALAAAVLAVIEARAAAAAAKEPNHG